MSKSQIETGLSFVAIEQSSFSLSYLGDAFYELWCRKKILQLLRNRKQVHQSVVQFVRCQTQARLVHLIMPHLTDEEKIFPVRAVTTKSFPFPNMHLQENIVQQLDLSVW